MVYLGEVHRVQDYIKNMTGHLVPLKVVEGALEEAAAYRVQTDYHERMGHNV